MAKTNHIKITKTARYYTLGKLNQQTQEVWFVLHGYAQLASDFIDEFEPLNNGTRFIVAPEGLNKFYAKGFGGKPSANWMTSEDRENEITDYVAYLNQLYCSLAIQPHIKVVVLGFSQGVATASRLIHHTIHRFNMFIVHSGDIAVELINPLSERLTQLQTIYITGTQDPLIKPEKQQQVYALMHELNAKIMEFDGGHVLNVNTIASCIDLV